MKFWQLINSVVDGFVEKKLEKLGSSDVNSYFKARSSRESNSEIQYISSVLNHMHANVATLLTHISAMIASLGIILIVFDESKITQLFIFIEMISYSLFAIICVYILRYREENLAKEILNKEKDLFLYHRHYLIRRYLYIKCSNGVLITTAIFLITIISHVFILATSL